MHLRTLESVLARHFFKFALLGLLLVPAATRAQEPPRADAFDNASNFLACEGNPYALCYYSGPAGKIPTKQGTEAEALPCEVEGNNANCTCYAISEKQGEALKYNFVEVGSILNPRVRKQTQELCLEDGSNCLNLKNLKSCEGKSTGECQPAPVCATLGNWKTGAKQTLYENRKNVELISTFSFAFVRKHFFGSFGCETSGTKYAGCMTAPCTKGEDGLTQCTCPIWDGPYQIGQNYDGIACDISPNVWSAAYHEPKDAAATDK